MSLPPDAFVADAALRLEAPPAPPRRSGRLAAAVLIALVLEAGVFALVWFERKYQPPPETAEIPVEIVVEPPPPPPPPPTPEPTPTPEAQPQSDLTPGREAPKEGKTEHDDAQSGEKEKPAAPPPPPAPTPSPEATTPAAEAPAPELPKTEEAEAPPPLKAETPQPAAPSKPTVADVLAKALSQEIDLGGAAMKAPISGGQGKATYLNILYGLTKAHERIPAAVYTYSGKLVGVINVSIDGNGRLLTRYIAVSSGSPELDEAEMQAVAEASRKFPPPPGRAGISLSYTYGVR
jgi:TonB family protein